MRLVNVEPGWNKLDFILGAAQRLAASYGLQPLKIIVIKDAAVKKQLQPYIHSQKVKAVQSHLLVFAIWSVISEQKIEAYISDIATARHAAPSVLREDKRNVVKALTRQNEEGKKWAARQADIALRNVLKAAAEAQVSATVEEIDTQGFDQVLELSGQGLHVVGAVRLDIDATESRYTPSERVKAGEALFELI